MMNNTRLTLGQDITSFIRVVNYGDVKKIGLLLKIENIGGV